MDEAPIDDAYAGPNNPVLGGIQGFIPAYNWNPPGVPLDYFGPENAQSLKYTFNPALVRADNKAQHYAPTYGSMPRFVGAVNSMLATIDIYWNAAALRAWYQAGKPPADWNYRVLTEQGIRVLDNNSPVRLVLHISNGYIYTNIMGQRKGEGNAMHPTNTFLLLGKSMIKIIRQSLNLNNNVRHKWLDKMLYMFLKFNGFARAAGSAQKFTYQYREGIANGDSNTYTQLRDYKRRMGLYQKVRKLVKANPALPYRYIMAQRAAAMEYKGAQVGAALQQRTVQRFNNLSQRYLAYRDQALYQKPARPNVRTGSVRSVPWVGGPGEIEEGYGAGYIGYYVGLAGDEADTDVTPAWRDDVILAYREYGALTRFAYENYGVYAAINAIATNYLATVTAMPPTTIKLLRLTIYYILMSVNTQVLGRWVAPYTNRYLYTATYAFLGRCMKYLDSYGYMKGTAIYTAAMGSAIVIAMGYFGRRPRSIPVEQLIIGVQDIGEFMQNPPPGGPGGPAPGGLGGPGLGP